MAMNNASPPRAPVATGWAVQSNDGGWWFDLDAGSSEQSAWIRALMTSDKRAIAEAKRRGARSFRVEVFQVEEGE